MSIFNKKPKKKTGAPTIRVAGGQGKIAHKESILEKYKRLLSLFLVGEERYYPEGMNIESDIYNMSGTIAEKYGVGAIAKIIEKVRLEYGLRHAPIIAMIGTLHSGHSEIFDILPEKVMKRPSDLTDLLAFFFKINRKKFVPHKLRGFIEKALHQYDEYQLEKYKQVDHEVSLYDVFNLVHPKPRDKETEQLWHKFIYHQLPKPKTWEIEFSTRLNNVPEDQKDMVKKQIWEELLKDNKLGSLALIRNLRNMLEVEVDTDLIVQAIEKMNVWGIFPTQILNALVNIYDKTIEDAIIKKYFGSKTNRIKGSTLVILDISGSMGNFTYWQSTERGFRALGTMYSIINAAEKWDLVLTSGDDDAIKHASMFISNKNKIANPKVFAEQIERIYRKKLGYGGIFTYQVIDWALNQNKSHYDRIVVISDSQDMDRNRTNNDIARLFDGPIYINNIASYKYVGYATSDDKKVQEITTFTDKVVDFILLNEENFEELIEQ